MNSLYPVLAPDAELDKIRDWCRFVTQTRQTEDVPNYDNLGLYFMRGRRVDRVPSSSSDVVVGDSENDFTTDGDYLYFLVNRSGTLTWTRLALTTSW